MGKTAEATRSTSTASLCCAPFFEKKGSTPEAAPSFFTHNGHIQTKLAIGKSDDPLEQEADQVADKVQAKLAVGAPDDPYETEADQMADKVVSQVQNASSVQTKKQPAQTGRECEEGDYVFLKPASIQRLGEDIDGNGSRESIVAAARSMIGKIQAKHAEGGQRVGAKYLLEIFHLAAPGVWDDSIVTTAGVKMPSWCGIFSVWAHKKAGKDIGTWQIGKGVSAFGTIQQTTNPQAGDIGYIDQPFQHHCIIVKVDGNNVHSIDGNSGLYSEVKENTRPLSAYTGFFTAFGAGSSVQKKSKVQRKGKGEVSSAPSPVEQTISSTRGKGDALPGNVQQSMGSAMGADFSEVRIHNDHAAADMSNALDAQAFTHGKDIYFNRGKYNPSSKDGQHLLAHELTHTVQQGASAQRKANKKINNTIQKNGNTTTTSDEINEGEFNSYDPADKKGSIKKSGKSYTIRVINLSIKGYADQSLVEANKPFQRPKEARNTKQGEEWRKQIITSIKNSLEAALPDTSVKNENLLVLELKSNPSVKVVGSFNQIAEEIKVPFWNKEGKPVIHEIEHRVDFQLIGNKPGVTDNIKNILLLDRRTNNQYGKNVKKDVQDHIKSIIDHYKKKFKSLPDTAKAMADKDYTIFFDSFSYEKVAPLGLIVKEFLDDPAHPFNPINKKNIDVRKFEITKGHFILKTSPDRAGYLIPYNAKGKILGGFKVTTEGDEEKHILTKLQLEPLKSNKKDNKILEKDLTAINFDLASEVQKPVQDVYIVSNQALAVKLKDLIGISGLSPVSIKNADIDSGLNLQVQGIVNHDVQFLKDNNIEVGFGISGTEAFVYASISNGNITVFPKPFIINDVSLLIFGSTERGLGVEGTLDFELAKIGKGQLKGMGSTFNGFGIEGGFEFDPELFKSKINASYKNKKFAFDGSVTLKEEKIPGVQSLSINVKYENEKLGGIGKAKLNIPGVKEIGIQVEQQDNGGLLIAGDIEFGNKLKSDAKVKAVFEKVGEEWKVNIKGELNPNINVAGLKITKVVASYDKGIFDVSAKVNFEKGKIKGDFDLGVTNGNIDADGKKLEGVGKELSFYASGEVTLDIVKDVDGKLQVKITKDGDVIIGGKIEVTKNKSIVDGKKADMNSDKSLKIFGFAQKIPVASCGVASLVLNLSAGIGLFYDFKGLTLDQGTKVTLEPVSLKDLSKAKVTSEVLLSTGVKAGVDAFIKAEAALEVLIAGFGGSGKINLKLTAFDANAQAKVEAGFSAEKGLEFKTAEMAFDVESKLSYDLELAVRVYLNLLITDVTLWEHSWKPESLQGEHKFSWLDGKLKVPMKFGENNVLAPEDVGSGLKNNIDAHSKDEKTYTDAAKDGVDGKAPDAKAEDAKTEERIKTGIAVAYRGAYTQQIFAFNSTMNKDYFDKRLAAWKIVDEHKTLKPELKEMLKKEIIKYEREEYDAFKKWLNNDTTFDTGSKNMIIDDFMLYRPTLGPVDRTELEAAAKAPIGTANSSSANSSSANSSSAVPSNNPLVLKKEIPGNHGYAVPDDFANRMEVAKANGLPLPLDVRAEMGKQFGADFSQVRVHYDNEAIALTSEVNAQAFTHENHIFFNNGKYEPASSEGKKLLAHELTHVLQQGHGEPVKRIAEKDPTGTQFTGNYIFNPGHDGLNSGFFNTVKRFVANGSLSDTEIRALRKDAIDRNGSILHAELLLMAAMKNPVNVALMQAHQGGPLILAMSNILQADKDYVINFDRAIVPPELANPVLRLAIAFLGLSGETVTQAAAAMDQAAEKYLLNTAGTQFADQANKLIVSAGFTNPVVPLPEVVTAMVNAAADGTPGDQIMAGIVYVVARRFGHATAPDILNGRLRVDALIPSLYRRLLSTGDATYSYSTDEDVRKANTLYIPTDTDIFDLSDRALIIHELTHAEDDFSRPAETLVDSLDLESRAYVAQGRHMMEEIIAGAPAPGFVTTASTYVNLGPLFYWSMLLAAKRNTAKYEAIFINICTSAPASMNQATVRTDLALTEAAISANIRAALLAYRSPGGQQLYTTGNTRLGGGSGHYFQ